jgi:hypothetical protein
MVPKKPLSARIITAVELNLSLMESLRFREMRLKMLVTFCHYHLKPVRLCFSRHGLSLEKRFSATGVSEALGYSKQWFSTFTKRPSKRLEVLHREGFTGSQIEVNKAGTATSEP